LWRRDFGTLAASNRSAVALSLSRGGGGGGKKKAKRSSKPRKVRILFSTEYVCGPGEKVVLVGEHRTLGQWNPLSGVAMRCVDKEGTIWQASVLLEKGASYEFKFVTVADGGAHVRWQDGSNRLINIPAGVPSQHGFGAHVPWEGISTVSKVQHDAMEIDALESLDSLQQQMGETSLSPAQQALYLGTSLAPTLGDEVLSEDDIVAEANSRAFDSAVSELDGKIEEAQDSVDAKDLASLERDAEVAAASRRVVIAMELMEEHELQKQLSAGGGEGGGGKEGE